MRAALSNRGAAPAKKSAVAFYLSRDASWSSVDVSLGKARVAALRPRAKASVSSRPRVPAAAPLLEPLRVLACADDGYKVTERNENNNCKAARTKILIAGKTPFDAIEADLVRGRINSEKALTYKLFAGFGDKRLPKRYDFAGDKPGGGLTAVAGEALARFDALSPPVQDVVAPFLVPRAYPGLRRHRGGEANRRGSSTAVGVPAELESGRGERRVGQRCGRRDHLVERECPCRRGQGKGACGRARGRDLAATHGAHGDRAALRRSTPMQRARQPPRHLPRPGCRADHEAAQIRCGPASSFVVFPPMPSAASLHTSSCTCCR